MWTKAKLLSRAPGSIKGRTEAWNSLDMLRQIHGGFLFTNVQSIINTGDPT